MRKLKEERKMKAYKFNRQDRTCAPWAALCVLGLVAAMVFAVPSGVFAQIIYELSQDCETARFGTEHTITATVTNAGVPVEDVALAYMVQGVNPKLFPTPIGFTNEEGIVEFGYTGSNLGIDNIWLVLAPPNSQSVLDTITTEWTEEDLCSSSQQVLVGGRLTLNPKKRGALKIAVCGTKDFEVSNVDPEKVRLAGVAPWHWKQKDSRLCPDGKDGVVDLVLKFKNRDVVEALEKDLDKELVVVDKDVRLALEGKLNDGTAFGGEWVAEIKKKGKRHGKNEQYQNHKNGKGKGPNK
jgi:hypothetical protein